ncbi:DUF1294 domain-containing protein [uncultured Ilyobacter sp.]|uniref:DUF1294 domain-containing protein n=1 Tax=uncultured Ilyobacter sp. TaxID=544433 RepID=UPI002AA8DAEB|nr:DUF1294 domain-containing protein [uncultured Ilyobacter sp.]
MEITFLKIFFIFLAVMNISTFIVYSFDKVQAKNDRDRVPELRLILMALFGGSIGALISMKVFNHKTRKWYFKYGVPVMALAHFALVVYMWARQN